jgi:hypothetical protein
MAQLKTFDVPAGNYMKNVSHGYVDISTGTGEEIHNVVAVTGEPNFFVFYEISGEIRSGLYDLYLEQIYTEGGFLKVKTAGGTVGAITARIHYGVYLDA